jgi:tRNA pseudouridine13 synthase
MKLKQEPEDFRVEEISRLEAGEEGEFSLYRLSKSGIGTPEALRVVRREWRLAPGDVAFSGLKDRHGITGQTVSIRRGPKSNFEGKGFRLNYLGRSPRPAGRGALQGNRFRIVLRDLSGEEAARAGERAREAAANGFPDYYDDQRFGSLRGTGGVFVAKALLRGDVERALRLAIASPSREDRSRTKRRRKLLKDRWGDFTGLARALDASVERRICARLAEGASFEEAYRILDRPLRQIHLAAYQAHLFNECLRRAIGCTRLARRSLGEGGPTHPGADGPYLFYEGDPGTLKDRVFPLASFDAPEDQFLDEVLEEEGVSREQLEGFRTGSRHAVAFPLEVEVGAPFADDRNPARLALPLSFRLGPGSYATMLVKRCTFDL